MLPSNLRAANFKFKFSTLNPYICVKTLPEIKLLVRSTGISTLITLESVDVCDLSKNSCGLRFVYILREDAMFVFIFKF